MTDMRKFIASLLIVASCSVYGQTPFEIDRAKVEAARKAGDISIVEEQSEMLSLAKIHFPRDEPMHMMISSLIEYAKQRQAGEITEDEYQRKIGGRIDRYNASIRARNSVAQQEIDEQDLRNQDAQRRNALMRALGAGANGMQRSIDQRKPTCQYVNTGGVITQTCY